MKLNSLNIRRFRSSKSTWRFLFAAMVFVAGQSYGADHFVLASTSTVDCRSFNGGVKPGDSIILAAGNRGPLTIRNCQGTSSANIIIRNDTTGTGPTVVRRTTAASGGFVFTCRDCVNVVIDGTGSWKGAPQGAYCGAPAGTNGCGIKVTSIAANDSPSTYLHLNGLTTNVIVRGVEIDGRMSDLKTGGIGIQQNDRNIKVADYPRFWRENIIYEMNYVHDVYGEGMYIGPNWREPDLEAPLRNITIRKNLIENTGRQNIQLKSAIDGTNRIHHNVVRRSGLRGESGQATGISLFEGGNNAKVYNNWIEASGAHGIQHYNSRIPLDKGPFTSDFFNNVIYDSGKGYGASVIRSGIQVGNSDGSALISANVYNNTIVKAAERGISFGSRVRGVARDNIVTDTSSTAISLGSNESINNLIGSTSYVKFEDSGRLNFRLTADSPARDTGSRTGFPSDDFPGVSRPQGSMADRGAFEFSNVAASPKPPGILGVD